MYFSKHLIKLKKASLHPPALDAGDEEEIPWVLLEYYAYVADRRNDTTAVAYSSCGREIQVSFFAARPPRVSYLCVFCRPAATEEHKEEEVEMIPIEPEVFATDENLVLLRIVVSPEKNITYGHDLYVYRPAGDGGPLLTRLQRPPGGIVFSSYQAGILRCPANRRDDSTGLSLLRPHRAPEDTFFMVAALCGDYSAIARGRFFLYLYNSKLQTWTTTNVSVEHQHFLKYQNDHGFLLHQNTRVVAVGGEDATIAFVDLWQGILLCDLSQVMAKPWLRYVPLPPPAGTPITGDACLSRDIAVVNGHFNYIQQQLHWKHCRGNIFTDEYFIDGRKSAVLTRPVSASSLLDDTWQPVCNIHSWEMDVKSSPDFQLLPKLEDNSAPFQRLHILHPTLSSHTDNTVCFMVKINQGDHKAWVIAVDMTNNRLQRVAEFDAKRSATVGFAYLHSRISKYLKRAPGTKGKLKRPGAMLLPGSSSKRLPGILEPMQPWWGGEHKQHDAKMEGMGEDGGDDMVLE